MFRHLASCLPCTVEEKEQLQFGVKEAQDLLLLLLPSFLLTLLLIVSSTISLSPSSSSFSPTLFFPASPPIFSHSLSCSSSSSCTFSRLDD